ncbi:MAG: DPP IV N-terminal domain-containing protein [Lewinellaceae bacterium]|nr:DPP IV N-terminal domain-containing protein [Lewinellaceae bacterium]
MRFFWTLMTLGLLIGPLAAQKAITLEDIWQNDTYKTEGIPGFNFRKDGVHYTLLTKGRIEEYDLRTGEKTRILFDATAVETDAADWTGAFDSYSFSPDETQLLLATQTEPIYRRSRQAQYFVVNLENASLQRLYIGKKQRYVTFSPDGSKVAFVVQNDLYFYEPSTGKTTRVTNDGLPNSIINGAPDWVYEEEFSLVRAFEWSPDGQQLAWLRFDETAVPSYAMEEFKGGMYPEFETFKYPKVGEKNSVVSAWIYHLTSGKKTEVQCTDEYLPRICWTPGNVLCVTAMNRHQNQLKLLLVDAATGHCNPLLEEKSPYYLDLQEPKFLADGAGFIWTSDKSGFRHLYLYGMDGQEAKALSKGKFDVTDYYGVDEKNGLLYYQAAGKNPMQREIYSVNLKGKKTREVATPGGFCSAQFSSTFDYFVQNFSTLNAAPQYSVCNSKGQLVRKLEQNQALREMQSACAVAPAAFFEVPLKNVPAPDGTWSGSLNGWMIRPQGAQYEGKQLPVLMFVYGGPGSQQVLDQWKGANYWWFQMLAQQGYVVACVDNRGTGARGEYFKKMTYLHLGQYETADQISAAKYLGTLPFVDSTRIGIFGWSYGGYMSSLCMLKGGDVFKAGIAVAPVTDWRWYDNIYTERYMQTLEENKAGYEDFAPAQLAEGLKGSYLLVHGLADDNVHFQHSAEMANALIAANKPFDSMLYPNRNHSIGDSAAKLHLYRLMTRFLNEHLKGTLDLERP